MAGDIVTRSAGNKVLFFGNGGSSMDAGHLAAELLGRFYYDRPSLASVSLPDSHRRDDRDRQRLLLRRGLRTPGARSRPAR